VVGDVDIESLIRSLSSLVRRVVPHANSCILFAALSEGLRVLAHVSEIAG